MNDETALTNHYKSLGYKNLHCLNFSGEAMKAYQESQNKQEHKIGRCEYLIACHDLKVFFTTDSSD